MSSRPTSSRPNVTSITPYFSFVDQLIESIDADRLLAAEALPFDPPKSSIIGCAPRFPSVVFRDGAFRFLGRGPLRYGRVQWSFPCYGL